MCLCLKAGNTVNGQGGYDHHINTHQENFNSAGGGWDPPRLPDNQVPAVQPPRQEREYNWKLAGATECSASCGKGQSNYLYFSFLVRMTPFHRIHSIRFFTAYFILFQM